MYTRIYSIRGVGYDLFMLIFQRWLVDGLFFLQLFDIGLFFNFFTLLLELFLFVLSLNKKSFY